MKGINFMGLDLYFYRCKRKCYEQLSHNPKALSAETQVADAHWMQQQRLTWEKINSFNNTDDFTLFEGDAVILVNGWLQHVGAAYRWLVEHTALTMDNVYPVKVNRDAIFELYNACNVVTALSLNADGSIDSNICEQYLPAIDEANCEYYQSAMGPDYFGTSWYGEEYQKEAQSVLDTLTLLLETIDFENEVVLVQASW